MCSSMPPGTDSRWWTCTGKPENFADAMWARSFEGECATSAVRIEDLGYP
ncbi:hypothetical protein ACXDF8_00550 [Mycolicibacterium sp. CBM1]